MYGNKCELNVKTKQKYLYKISVTNLKSYEANFKLIIMSNIL